MKFFRNLAYTLTISTIFSCSNEQSDHSSTKSWEEPDDAFRVGRGYDSNNPESVRGDCIVNAENFLEVSWRDAQGVETISNETRITSKEDLFKELNLSTSAKVKYGAFGGGGSYKQYEKFESSSESFTWLFDIKAVLGTKTLQTDRITDSNFTATAKALILKARAGDQNAKNDFYKLCGTKYVRSVKMGGSLTEVLEISSQAIDKVKEISAKMSASFGGSLLGASGNASYNSVLNQASKNSYLKREFTQIGGDAVQLDITDVNAKEKVDTFVKSLRNQNAKVISVEIVDWNTLLNFSGGDPVDIAREIQLNNLLKRMWKFQDDLNKIDTYLKLYENNVYDFTNSEVDALQEGYKKITKALDGVIQVGTSCFLNFTRCSESIDPIVIHYPNVKQRVTSENKELTTDNWSVTFPINSPFTYVSQNETKLWHLTKGIVKKSLDGVDLSLNFDVFETPCNVLPDLEAIGKSGRLLPSFAGLPIYYEEVFRSSGNKKVYSINLYSKSQKGCLQVQVWTDRAITAGVSITDSSDVSEKIREIAFSIKSKN